MATLYPTQDNFGNWSDPEWSLADDNAKNHVKPTGTDDVVLTANSSATMTVDETGLCASFDMGGYTGTLLFEEAGIDCGGDMTLDGTITEEGSDDVFVGGNLVLTAGMTLTIDLNFVLNATTGAKAITSNGITIGKFTINDGGGDASFTLQDDLTCGEGGFVLTDGILLLDGNTLTVDGSIFGTGGSIETGGGDIDVGANNITLDNIAVSAFGTITAANLNIGPGGSLAIVSGGFTTNANVLIDGGTLDLRNHIWTQTNGNTFTHTGGTVTCASDNSGTIDAAGNTISGITASNIIGVRRGVDGGGNTKLNFEVDDAPVGGMMSGMVGR